MIFEHNHNNACTQQQQNKKKLTEHSYYCLVFCRLLSFILPYNPPDSLGAGSSLIS